MSEFIQTKYCELYDVKNEGKVFSKSNLFFPMQYLIPEGLPSINSISYSDQTAIPIPIIQFVRAIPSSGIIPEAIKAEKSE